LIQLSQRIWRIASQSRRAQVNISFDSKTSTKNATGRYL
jgi:hypothetical protein